MARPRKTRVVKSGITEKNKEVIVTFESVNDILEYIKDTPEGNNSRREREDFVSHSWDQMLTMLKTGWSEGIKEVDIKSHEILNSLKQDTLTVYNYDVHGEFLDIGTYLTGNPECFLQAEPMATDKPIKKITVNLTASHQVNQQTLINRGAGIMGMIDTFYNQYFIDLTFVIKTRNCQGYDITMLFNANLKQGYDRDMIAFISCSPAMLRRVYFAVCEKITGLDHCGGYGNCQDVTTDGIYFPYLTSDAGYETIKESANTIQRYINQLTGN